MVITAAGDSSTQRGGGIAGVNLGGGGGGGGGGGAQAPSGLAIAPPRFIPKALRNGKV